MANPVNPPPFLRVPKAFLKDPEVRTFIEQQNIMLFQLYRKLGGTSDPVSEIGDQGITSFSALLQQATKQLGGLPEFTIDTTGFTIDTALITTDKANT